MDNIDLITQQLKRLAREHPELSIGELLEDVLPDNRTPEDLLIFKEQLEGMSVDARSICKTIFSMPDKVSKPGGRGYLKKRLRRMRWSWSRIYGSFKEIRATLKEMAKV